MFNKITVGILALIALTIAMMSLFTVKETELAIMLWLGEVVSTDFEPGLHIKSPVHNIRKFDKRIQTLNAKSEQFLTEEKKNLIVDSYIKWRIFDVETYFTASGGSNRRASQRLSEMIADGLRSEFGKRTIQEVVSGDRVEIMKIITEEANHRAEDFGITIIDIRINRIELPAEVRNSVYSRMEAERERVAQQLRSQGEAEGLRIRAKADRERIELISQAEQEAEKIRGEGDAEAAKIYAEAYNKDTKFYEFYRSLNAYRKAMQGKGDVLLLNPDSEFFNHFNPKSLSE